MVSTKLSKMTCFFIEHVFSFNVLYKSVVVPTLH